MDAASRVPDKNRIHSLGASVFNFLRRKSDVGRLSRIEQTLSAALDCVSD